MISKHFRPFHLDFLGFISGMLMSLLINLLTSYEPNDNLDWAIWTIILAFFCTALYSVYYLKKQDEAKKAIDYIEQETNQILTPSDRLIEEDKIWNPTKPLFFIMAIGIAFLTPIGIYNSVQWRREVGNASKAAGASSSMNASTLSNEVKLLTNEVKLLSKSVQELKTKSQSRMAVHHN